MLALVKKQAKTTLLALFVVGATMLGMAAPAFAAPGDLDTSFGANGIASVNSIATFYSVAVQPDGKLLAAGGGGCGPTFCGSSVPFLARFNADGSLDASFGSGGIAAVADYDVRMSLPLALQADGKPLTVSPFLTRFSTSGALESIFTNSAPCGQTNSLSPFGIFTKADDAATLLKDLVKQVNSLNLKQSIQNSLDAKLRAAEEKLAAAKAKGTPVCVRLTAFVNEVQAQTGKAITPSQATQLITRAMRIETLPGCQ